MKLRFDFWGAIMQQMSYTSYMKQFRIQKFQYGYGSDHTPHRRNGVVVRASPLLSVDLGFIP